MSKPKKVTYKELNDRIGVSFERIIELHQNLDYVHTLVLKYIKFKDEEDAFLKFVKEDREKMEKKVRENERKVEQSEGKKTAKLGKG
mgnify:CR=1 FL=1